MKRLIYFKDRCIEYTLIQRANVRRLRLAVRHDGSIYLTAPKRVQRKYLDQFLAQHSEWISEAVERVKKLPIPFLRRGAAQDFQKYKQSALVLVRNRIEYFNKFYTFSYTSLSIRNQKTRWGSCSKRGSLNFNYRIALLPAALADYIVVHELCHLKEMNHSQRFWKLVANVIPNHLALRRELKKM